MGQLNPDGDFIAYLEGHAAVVERLADLLRNSSPPAQRAAAVNQYVAGLDAQARQDRDMAAALRSGGAVPDSTTPAKLPDLGLSCGT